MGKVTITATVEFDNEAEVKLATELLKTIEAITATFNGGGGAAAAKGGAKSEKQAAPVKAARAPVVPVVADTESKMQELVELMVSPEEHERILQSLHHTFEKMDEEGFNLFFNIYTSLIFNPNPRIRPESVKPFLEAIVKLDQRWYDVLRTKITPKLLKILTVKRAINCDRKEVYAFAEAFAVLVKIGVVAMNGAVKTIAMLLKKPENRCAAVTMLGKTVEMCHKALLQQDQSALNDLRAAFELVTEKEFEYDIEFIRGNLKWIAPSASTPTPTSNGSTPTAQDAPPSAAPAPRAVAPTPSNAPAPAGLNIIDFYAAKTASPVMDAFAQPGLALQLKQTASYNLHEGAIFTLTVDEQTGTMISTARDGKMVTWDMGGLVKGVETLDRHYACSADINPNTKSLFLCGVSRESAGHPNHMDPCILQYNRKGSGAGWGYTGSILRNEMKIVTCVKCIGKNQGNSIAAGEQKAGGGGRKEVVCVYDVQSSNMSMQRPTVQYYEHNEIITCISAHPRQQDVFFSGSKDCVIKMWDKRVPDRSAATLQGHSAMITCLDSFDYSLVSGAINNNLLVWDMRNSAAPVSNVNLDQGPILKIAAAQTSGNVGAAGLVAVSSMKGLFLLRVSDQKGFKAVRESRDTQPYHDLKWTGETLWAAGEDKTIDRYEIVRA